MNAPPTMTWEAMCAESVPLLAADGLPTWATAVLASVLTSMLTAIFGWWMLRTKRTVDALDQLYGLPAMQRLLAATAEENSDLKDPGRWTKYEQEVLTPVATTIEIIAALTNRRWHFLPGFYSFRIICRVARETLVGTWHLESMQHHVTQCRNGAGEDVYSEFQTLAERLERTRPLRRSRP